MKMHIYLPYVVTSLSPYLSISLLTRTVQYSPNLPSACISVLLSAVYSHYIPNLVHHYRLYRKSITLPSSLFCIVSSSYDFFSSLSLIYPFRCIDRSCTSSQNVPAVGTSHVLSGRVETHPIPIPSPNPSLFFLLHRQSASFSHLLRVVYFIHDSKYPVQSMFNGMDLITPLQLATSSTRSVARLVHCLFLPFTLVAVVPLGL